MHAIRRRTERSRAAQQWWCVGRFIAGPGHWKTGVKSPWSHARLDRNGEEFAELDTSKKNKIPVSGIVRADYCICSCADALHCARGRRPRIYLSLFTTVVPGNENATGR